MARKANVVDIPSLGTLDRSSGQLGRQLAQALRAAIRRGDLKPGEALPSTRMLARSLTIARGTLPLALFGPTGYGFRQGTIGAAARLAQAAAPIAFGVLLDTGGPVPALAVSGGLSFLAFLAFVALRR